MINNNRRYSTKELETYIHSVYAKLEPTAKKDGVYKPLDDYFDTGTPNGRDGSFCYSDDEGYHFSVNERGLLRVNIVTQSLSEITYQVLSSDIFWMAVEYESTHRIEEQDFRRLLFQKELQYWSILGPEFTGQAERKITDTLRQSPFQDDLLR